MRVVVSDRTEFARKLCPRFFSHDSCGYFLRTMDSFMFRLVDKCYYRKRDSIEFIHKHFHRGGASKLHLVAKKNGSKDVSKDRQEDIRKLGDEYEEEQIKAHQEELKLAEERRLRLRALKLKELADDMAKQSLRFAVARTTAMKAGSAKAMTKGVLLKSKVKVKPAKRVRPGEETKVKAKKAKKGSSVRRPR